MNENPKNEQLEFLKPRKSPDGFGNVDYHGENVVNDDYVVNEDATPVFEKDENEILDQVNSNQNNNEQLELHLEMDNIRAELKESGIEINDEPNKPSEFDEGEGDDDDEKLSPYEELYGHKL